MVLLSIFVVIRRVAVIPGALRRRPLRAPGINSFYFFTLLAWRIASLHRQSDCGAPFSVGWQPISLAGTNPAFGPFQRRQPFTEFLRIEPRHIHRRMACLLSKTGARPFVGGGASKRPVVLHPG